MSSGDFLTDRELIDKVIATNLRLIKDINRNPDHKLGFDKDLLIRGINVLQNKTSLNVLERANMLRFTERWGSL